MAALATEAKALMDIDPWLAAEAPYPPGGTRLPHLFGALAQERMHDLVSRVNDHVPVHVLGGTFSWVVGTKPPPLPIFLRQCVQYLSCDSWRSQTRNYVIRLYKLRTASPQQSIVSTAIMKLYIVFCIFVSGVGLYTIEKCPSAHWTERFSTTGRSRIYLL